jgi:hypothetical protein
MSLLIRAALLGGLAYVVSRAARKSQHSIDSSRSEARRLARAAEDNQDEQSSTQNQPSIPHV